MEFNAKGKGPLELPRLTSLGPGSEPSKEIGEIVFRGSTLKDLNNDEFVDNSISGRPVDIWTFDTPSALKQFDIEYNQSAVLFNDKPIEDSPNDLRDIIQLELGIDHRFNIVSLDSLYENNMIANHTEFNVTGGLSTNLGTSVGFAASEGFKPPDPDIEEDVGLVMFLEKNRIPARLTKAKQTKSFVKEYPEIAGAAGNGGRMLKAPSVNSDLELTSPYTYYRISSWEDGKVVNWNEIPIAYDNGQFFRIPNEEELFAHSSKIDLDKSLFGLCAYIDDEKLDELYDRIDGGDAAFSTKVGIVYDKVKNLMESNQDRLVMLVYEYDRTKRISEKVSKDMFIGFFDGDTLTSDYSKAIPFTDPSQF